MKTAKLFDYEIFNSTFRDALDVSLRLIDGNRAAQIVTINPEMINFAFKNADFAKILHDADMLLPDGIGIKLALQLTGKKSCRIAGIDFAYKLLQECGENGITAAFIGAEEDVLSKAVMNIKVQIPGLKIVYAHNGFFENSEEIYSSLENAGPGLILAALGSPKQEFFIEKAKQHLKSGLLIGVGGSFDVWAGKVKRAPLIFRKFGLEWLYRTILQPERIRRIFPVLPLFLIKVLKERFKL